MTRQSFASVRSRLGAQIKWRESAARAIYILHATHLHFKLRLPSGAGLKLQGAAKWRRRGRRLPRISRTPFNIYPPYQKQTIPKVAERFIMYLLRKTFLVGRPWGVCTKCAQNAHKIRDMRTKSEQNSEKVTVGIVKFVRIF